MANIRINLQNANNIKEELISKYLTGLKSEMINNPQFESQLYSAVNLLTRTKPGEGERVHPLDLVISDDGSKFEIRSSVRPDPDCLNQELQGKNMCYEQVKFEVNENEAFLVTTSTGTIHDLETVKKVNAEMGVDNKWAQFNGNTTPTLLSAQHRNVAFLANGIQISSSSYSDSNPTSLRLSDTEALKNQTMIREPEMWGYYGPVPPSRPFNPSIAHSYRLANELEIIHFSVMDGKNPAHVAEYAALTEYPELMRYISGMPIQTQVNGVWTINPVYAEAYPGMTAEQIKKVVREQFLNGIDMSKSSSEMCEVMKQQMNGGFQR